MAKQMEAHLQEESKLWSFLVLCQKQIMNARRRNKERNLTWRNSRGQQLLDTFRVLSGVHFMHTICRFEAQEVRSPTLQQVHNRSWNEEVIAIGNQLHQAASQFRSCEITTWAAKSAFLCEMETFSLRNFAAHVACLWNPPKCFQIFATDSFRFFLQIFVV